MKAQAYLKSHRHIMPGLYNERRLVEKPIPNDRPSSSSQAQTDHFLNAIQPNDSDSDSTSDADSDELDDAPIDAPSVAVINAPRNALSDVPGNAPGIAAIDAPGIAAIDAPGIAAIDTPGIAAIDAPRNGLGEVPVNAAVIAAIDAPGDVLCEAVVENTDQDGQEVDIKTETEPVLDYSSVNNEEIANILTPLEKPDQEPSQEPSKIEVDEDCTMIFIPNQFPQPKSMTCDGLIKQNGDDISADQPFIGTVS